MALYHHARPRFASTHVLKRVLWVSLHQNRGEVIGIRVRDVQACVFIRGIENRIGLPYQVHRGQWHRSVFVFDRLLESFGHALNCASIIKALVACKPLYKDGVHFGPRHGGHCFYPPANYFVLIGLGSGTTTRGIKGQVVIGVGEVILREEVLHGLAHPTVTRAGNRQHECLNQLLPGNRVGLQIFVILDGFGVVLDKSRDLLSVSALRTVENVVRGCVCTHGLVHCLHHEQHARFAIVDSSFLRIYPIHIEVLSHCRSLLIVLREALLAYLVQAREAFGPVVPGEPRKQFVVEDVGRVICPRHEWEGIELQHGDADRQFLWEPFHGAYVDGLQGNKEDRIVAVNLEVNNGDERRHPIHAHQLHQTGVVVWADLHIDVDHGAHYLLGNAGARLPQDIRRLDFLFNGNVDILRIGSEPDAANGDRPVFRYGSRGPSLHAFAKVNRSVQRFRGPRHIHIRKCAGRLL